MVDFNDIVEQLKENKEQNKKSLSNVNKNIAHHLSVTDEDLKITKGMKDTMSKSLTAQIQADKKAAKDRLEKETKETKAKPLDDIAKEMGSKSFDGIKKFLGYTTIFLLGVLAVLKLLQNPAFREGVMNFLNGVKKVWTWLSDQAKSFDETIAAMPDGRDAYLGIPTALAVIPTVFTKIAGFFGKDGRIMKLFSSVGAAFKDTALVKATGGPPGKIVTSIIDKVKGVAGFLKKMFSPITKVFKLFMGATKLLPALSLVGNVAKGIPILGQIIMVIQAIFGFIKGAIEGYKEGGIMGAITGGLKGVWDGVVGNFLNLLTGILAWIFEKLGLTFLSDFLKDLDWSADGIINWFTVTLPGYFTKLFTWIGDLFPSWETIKTKVKEAVGVVGEVGSHLVGFVIKPFIGLFEWIGNLFPSWADMKAGFLKLTGIGGEEGGEEGFLTMVTKPFIGLFEWISDLFPSWEDLKAGFEEALGFAGDAASWLLDIITKPFEGAFEWIAGLFPSWEGLKEKVVLALGFAGDGASWLLDIITKPFEGVFNFIKKIFDFDFIGALKKIPGVGKVISWVLGDGDGDVNLDKAQETADEIARVAAIKVKGEEGGYTVDMPGRLDTVDERAEKIAELEEQLAEQNRLRVEQNLQPIVVTDMKQTSVNQVSTGNTLSIQKETKKQDFVNYDNVAYDYSW